MPGESPDIFEEDQLLAQTARMDFAFARHVQQKALDTHDTAELSNLARAYTRLTRSLRQTLALLSKQRADRQKADRDQARHETLQGRDPEREAREAAIDQRTAQVQEAVDRVISATADGDEQLHTDWCHRFDRESCDWTEEPDWLVDDIDTVVRRVCKTLGLPDDYARRWRELRDPTFFPDPEPEAPLDKAAIWGPPRYKLAPLPDDPVPDAPPKDVPTQNSA